VDTEERTAFTAAAENWMVRGGGVDIEIVPQGTLGTEEMILNIGPQHPSTHGVLRIVLELDGEVITRAEPVIGYMHRGAEKLAEYRDARQVLVLMNRHDWLSAFNNELGWIIAVERLAGIEVPERAQWIRTMLAEGKSEAQIKQYFVEHYGARVLAEPPNRLLTYLVPATAILLGAFLLFRGFQMWMKPSITEAGVEKAEQEAQPIQDPYVARLEEELKKRK